MPGDETIGAQLAGEADLPLELSDMVLEGGAIDTDGTGLAITTEQCLLNPNRNRWMTRDGIAVELARQLGLDRVVWFGEGLINGALTARVGLAALEVCRPLPFVAAKRPSVSALVSRAVTGLFD